jgi:hypothetical protein
VSDQQTSRQQLVALLTPLLPKTWKVIPFQRDPGVLSQVTVMVHMTNISQSPAAPRGALLSEYTVSVFDPQTDPERAQGALDDEVLELIHAISSLPGGVVWDSAEPVLFSNSLGWDIKVTATTTTSGKDA